MTTKKDQNIILERLQSIATLAVEAQQDHADHSTKLAELQDAVNGIESDLAAINRILDAQRDPSDHAFRASPGFADCCRFCGDSESAHG